jgi:hypothetical protein
LNDQKSRLNADTGYREDAANTIEGLLRAALATVARNTFSPAGLAKIVAPAAGSEKQLMVYKMCDGEGPQAARKTNLLKGTLSGSITRWVETGIMVPVGPERLRLHVYPLSKCALRGEEK